MPSRALIKPSIDETNGSRAANKLDVEVRFGLCWGGLGSLKRQRLTRHSFAILILFYYLQYYCYKYYKCYDYYYYT